MNDVIKTIETLIATYERVFVLEVEQGSFDEAADNIKTLNFWCEQHILMLKYLDHLENRRRFAELEQQALAVSSFQRGQPQ